MSVEPENIIAEVDDASCAKAGALSAYGFSDRDIADTLIISLEQVAWAKTTDQYKQMFADKSAERAMTAIDLSDGWDGIEKNAVAKVKSALEWNNDPKFALLAARTANAAKRSVGAGNARTINPSQAGRVLHITLNQQFVNRTQSTDNVIEASPARPAITRKKVDMPTAKQVTDLLAPARPLLEKMRAHDIEDQMTALNFGDLKSE